MQNDKYVAHVYVNREVLSDKNIIRFSARVVFPDGAEIVKYLDAPNSYTYQMDFSRYMHALKSDSIKAKNNG